MQLAFHHGLLASAALSVSDAGVRCQQRGSKVIDHSCREMAREERNAAITPERVLARKDFLLDSIGRLKHTVDFPHLFEALDARGDRKTIVLLPGLDEHRPGSNQSSDIL